MRIVSVLIALIIAQVICAQTQAINNANSSSSQFTVINTGTSDNLISISKINNNLLISGESSYLVKSYDNCNTLLPVNLPSFPSSQNSYYYITRVDTNVLYLNFLGLNWQSQLWRSNNGGNSWVKKLDTLGFNYLTPIGYPLFFDTLNGLVFADYYKTILTVNGINTYTVKPLPTSMGNVSPVTMTVIDDSSAIFSDGMYGGAYLTKNRGLTWQGVMVAGAARDFEVVNKDSVYYISNGAWTTNARFFGYTFDGGINWNYKVVDSISGNDPPKDLYLSMCVKNKNEIYILARNGYVHMSSSYTGYGVILKSTDVGQTWSRVITPYVKNFTDMKFLNDSIALISGEGGLLFKWNTKQAVFVGVKENSTNNTSIKIYPNPSNDILNIDLDILNGNSSKLQILNSLGQIVTEEKIKDPKSQINLSHFPSGVYTLKVFIENDYKTFKVIKN